MRKKAVVLLSGGLDSATTLYYAGSEGYDCRCLVFDYGQRHIKEMGSAKKIAGSCGAGFEIIKIKLPWKGSALLDKNIAVPEKRTDKGIPSTYVPARNTIFLSFAVSYAEAIGAAAIFIGANAIDFSGYPDCRPEYYRVFNNLIKCGTKAGVEKKRIRIFTPFINMTKAEIIKTGGGLKVPYEHTWSCYSGGKRPCLKCDSCVLRAKGFKEAGLSDPLEKI
jgi:7-cyano-7-deazaguanine synthase